VGWLPVHRDQLRAQRSVMSMGELYLLLLTLFVDGCMIRDLLMMLPVQFTGAMANRLKSTYGEFCSRHNEAVQLYKVLFKSDDNFQTFIKVSAASTYNLLHRFTPTAYLYSGCLPWYNVVLTSRVHSSVKYSQQSQLRTRATVE